MLEIIKQFVRRMLMGKGKGILQIPPQKAVDDFAKDLLKKFKQNGIPDEAITNPRDFKIIWEQITNKEAQILSTNLKDILRKPDPFKKAGEVVDLTGKKIDTSKPILGGKNVPEDVVTETITLIKSKKPIDAMKEANLVIGRKGKYKNLTIEESQDILKKTDDHIFERDIKYDADGEEIIDWDEVDKIDPEDFAYGGLAGMLGERTGYKKGELVDEVNGLMEKTPFFTQEDYDKVKYKDPKGKYAVKNWGKGEAPLAEATEDKGIISYMGKFVKGETEKNLDKAKVLAHEKLHLLWEDPEVRATAPPEVQEQFSKADKLWKKYEKASDAGDNKKADAYYDEFDKTSSGVPLDPDNPTTGGGDVTGEELYTRFIENKYFPKKTESDEGPWGDRVHFDKTLKAQWDPYAERFDELMKSRKANGGIAGMLGEPAYADGGRTGFKGKKI